MLCLCLIDPLLDWTIESFFESVVLGQYLFFSSGSNQAFIESLPRSFFQLEKAKRLNKCHKLTHLSQFQTKFLTNKVTKKALAWLGWIVYAQLAVPRSNPVHEKTISFHVHPCNIEFRFLSRFRQLNQVVQQCHSAIAVPKQCHSMVQYNSCLHKNLRKHLLKHSTEFSWIKRPSKLGDLLLV